MRVADWADANLTAIVDHLNEKLAFLHGDARSDNMLFTGAGTGEGLVLIDFGMVSSGRPAWDVAYLLSSTLPPGPSARSELLRLCASYHTNLVAAGVASHSLEQFLNDIDLCLGIQIHRMILTAAIFVGEGYGDGTLAELWMRKVIDQLPEELPVVGEVA
jgi:aminoglycoside/choline kinase family phosphotransferase